MREVLAQTTSTLEPVPQQPIGDPATLKDLEVIFANVVSVVFALAGIVLFVMLVLGGFKYLTSGGDPKATEAAKSTLTHAITGLIILIFAFLILRFIATITGVESILNFQVVR